MRIAIKLAMSLSGEHFTCAPVGMRLGNLSHLIVPSSTSFLLHRGVGHAGYVRFSPLMSMMVALALK